MLATLTNSESRNRKWFFWALQVLIAVGLFLFIVRKIHVDDLRDLLQTLHWDWILLAFSLYCLDQLFIAIHIKMLLKKNVSLLELYLVLLLRRFAGSMFPGGSEALFLLLGKQQLGLSYTEGLSGALQMRFWGWSFIALWGIFAAVFLTDIIWIRWICLLLSLLPLGYGLIIWSIGKLDHLSSFFDKFTWLSKYKDRFLNILKKYQGVQANAIASPKFIILIAILNFTYVTMTLFRGWFLYTGMGLNLSFFDAIIIVLFLSAVSNLPVRVLGGLGINSASVYILLITLELANEAIASAFSIAYQIILYLFLVTSATIAWISLLVIWRRREDFHLQDEFK